MLRNLRPAEVWVNRTTSPSQTNHITTCDTARVEASGWNVVVAPLVVRGGTMVPGAARPHDEVPWPEERGAGRAMRSSHALRGADPPGADPPAGSIHVEPADGRTVIRLVGEIDAALRDQASAGMAAALVAGLPVLLDATRATFVDSSGIAFVLQLNLAASEAGLPVRLLDPRRVLADVLAVVGAAIPEA